MGIDWIAYGYLGLFGGAFLSATLIPLPSEAMVLAALGLNMDPITVLFVATGANFLGGLTNYWLGYTANNQKLRTRFRMNEESVALWQKRSNRWGYWLGLISWLPFLGDPMVLVLGFLKVPFWPLAVTMFLGKCARYAFIIWLYFQV